MNTAPLLSFDEWLLAYRGLAREQNLDWLADAPPTAQQRAAWEQGIAPDEELDELASMAQWRGCGCGGA